MLFINTLYQGFFFPSAVIRKGFGDTGLVAALLSVLTSSDQELLFHAARAVSRMSYDSCKLTQSEASIKVNNTFYICFMLYIKCPAFIVFS